jgi:acylphosphatase
MKATRFLVSGVVQGVGYRFFAVRAAEGLGISGYARNLPDGRVEVLAQGAPDALSRFKDVLRQGPRGGRVDSIESSEAALDPDLDDFEIRR